jgi:hypothetical protein
MPPPRITPRSAAEWAAVLPVWLGMAGLVATLLFWMVTGRFEAAFLTTFGGLLLGGQGLQVLQELKSPPEPPRRRARKPTASAPKDKA